VPKAIIADLSARHLVTVSTMDTRHRVARRQRLPAEADGTGRPLAHFRSGSGRMTLSDRLTWLLANR
jgi:hypothetical protein